MRCTAWSKLKISNMARLQLMVVCFLLAPSTGCFLLILALTSGSWPVVENREDILEIDSCVEAIRCRGLSDQDIPALSRLKCLRGLSFGAGHKAVDSKITDHGLKELSKLDLPRLEQLNLSYNPAITDKGLYYLKDMVPLKSLILHNCPNISGEGLAVLTQLRSLHMHGNDQITWSDLKLLKNLKELEILDLSGCSNVSLEDLDKIRELLPDCYVRKNGKAWRYGHDPPED